tara:strand:+ start:183 stop:644 length:462 start_codon:yes stop_codon:yes gene_type:complete
MEPINNIDFILNIVLAMVAGMCVGIERQMKDKNAGLKTNALVAVGAAMYVNISYQYLNIPDVDISRIISQVIVGVGFLGAGVIVQGKRNIHGLATAAAIWCSAGLGCLAALKMYIPLAASTVLIILINLIFGYYSRIISKNSSENNKQSENTE